MTGVLSPERRFQKRRIRKHPGEEIVLRERPALGRTFVEADCSALGASPVAVLNDDLWQTRFGADPLIVGKSISLNHAKFVVIGVAAPGFRGLDPWPSAFWAPVTMQKALEPDADLLLNDYTGWLAVLGRMRPGVFLERALGESEQRLYALNAWRETPFYSERERAALDWTEAVTLVSQTHVLQGNEA